ncbi:hypothetical protein [Aquimarina sp. AU474]|uniref:hypothetical protein n=1 Tax=Aquimarina sp. AU474 TaxID=2108529 RepID=UPI001359734A|nr:hypothetical protein [Aquimarina sp. AU474]
MKQHTSQKFGIKKLTIAKINTASLHKIKGGTSKPPLDEPTVNDDIGDTICYMVH